MKKFSAGFAVWILIIVAAVVLAIIGAAGWYVSSSSSTAPATASGTIDANSLTSTSSYPTISGSAATARYVGVYIYTGSFQGTGFLGDAPVTNGRWSITMQTHDDSPAHNPIPPLSPGTYSVRIQDETLHNNLDNYPVIATGTLKILTPEHLTTQNATTTSSIAGSPFAAESLSGKAGYPVAFSSAYGGKTDAGYFIDWGDNAAAWYTCGQSIPVLHISGGDAEKCLPQALQHTYVSAGTYVATLNKITGIYADGHYTSAVVGSATTTITGINTLPPPTCTLTASPSVVDAGQPVTISWATQHANAEGPAGYGAWLGLEGLAAPTSFSGSQTITATGSGSQKIGLDINGPGGTGEGQCSVTIVVDGTSSSGLETYTNAQYGFSVQYPSSVTVNPGFVESPESGTNSLITFETSLDTGCGFFEGYVSAHVTTDPESVAECMADSSQGFGTFSTTTINGIPFAVSGVGGAGAGTSEDFESYSTLSGGMCYSLEQDEYFHDGCQLTSQAKPSEQKDIESIIQSFRFTN